MKRSDESELLSWSRDVAKIADVELVVLREVDAHKTLFVSVTEKLLLVTVIMSLTLVCSAAYYFVYSAPPIAAPGMEGINMGLMSAGTIPPTTEEPTTSSTTTTTTSTTTTSTTTSTSTSTSTTTSTTTTIDLSACGNDLQEPCPFESGPKCNAGNELGAENICHIVKCAPTVRSGMDADGCGVFSLSYCQD